MAQAVKVPKFVRDLVAALTAYYPGAEIDVERVPRTNRYRLLMVSPRFDRIGHLRRQHKVWDIVQETLEDKDLVRISMIVTLSPKEFATP